MIQKSQGTNENPRYNAHMTSHIEKKKKPVFSRPAGAQRILSLHPIVKTVGYYRPSLRDVMRQKKSASIEFVDSRV